ncbi:MAG: prefoldin subunit beta [Candidatus Aenigmarchaeota archaeon]|nr:prefoldin subunit beta [Candidatus Aenigmarchaeota archaeon]
MSDQVSDLSAQFQALQQQYQTIAMQKEQSALQVLELERAGKAVDTSTGDVFKAAGPILLKADKKTVQENLKDEKETAAIRMKRLDAQEKSVRERLEEMQKKLMETYKVSK